MEKALLCLTRNDYEPDLCFFGREKADVSLSPQAIRGRNRIVRRCRLSDPGTSCFRPCDPSRNATASSRVKRLTCGHSIQTEVSLKVEWEWFLAHLPGCCFYNFLWRNL